MDIIGGTHSVVTTDFDYLYLIVNNPYSNSLKGRTIQKPSAQVDMYNENLQILDNRYSE